MPSLRIGQLLTLGIFCCSSLTVGNAYLQKGQFYPSVVYLTNSSPSMAVIYAQAAVIVWLMAQAMGKIFFGQLRPAEVEVSTTSFLQMQWFLRFRSRVLFLLDSELLVTIHHETNSVDNWNVELQVYGRPLC